jgi:hypothetical protein
VLDAHHGQACLSEPASHFFATHAKPEDDDVYLLCHVRLLGLDLVYLDAEPERHPVLDLPGERRRLREYQAASGLSSSCSDAKPGSTVGCSGVV